MDEVKAAAERLTAAYAYPGKESGPVYAGFLMSLYRADVSDDAYDAMAADEKTLARAYLASPPRDLFDAVCEKLENLIPATASLVDFAKEKGVFLMRQVDEQLNECRAVLARVAAWRKEVGG